VQAALVANEVNKAQKLKKLKDEQKAKAAAAGKASEAGSTASSGATSPATGEGAGFMRCFYCAGCTHTHVLGIASSVILALSRCGCLILSVIGSNSHFGVP
jgi:hypothetical protein